MTARGMHALMFWLKIRGDRKHQCEEKYNSLLTEYPLLCSKGYFLRELSDCQTVELSFLLSDCHDSCFEVSSDSSTVHDSLTVDLVFVS